MKLTGLQMKEFIQLLGSDAPAPGGGSAAALTGAIGVCLTKMVASLTIGREKYREHDQLMVETLEAAEKLKSKLYLAIDQDTEAFNGVSAVFKMPKETEQEKSLRRAAMQLALKRATVVPYEIMTYAADALEWTQTALGKSNTNAISDLGVASLTLKAAIQGAWLNVLINLGGITDEAFVAEYTEKGKQVLEKSLPMADDIYEKVLESL